MSKIKDQDTEPVVYTIPSNFIDSGRIFNGMFKTRNFIEAIIVIAIMFLILNLIPFSSITTKIAVMVSVIGPLALACLVGINDDTAFSFVASVFSWRKKRRIMLYNRNQEVQKIRALDALMDRTLPRDKIMKFINNWKEQRKSRSDDFVLIEGETFQFVEDPEIARINEAAAKMKRAQTAASNNEPEQNTPASGTAGSYAQKLDLSATSQFAEDFDDE